MTFSYTRVWHGPHGPCIAAVIYDHAECVVITDHSNGHPEGRGRNQVSLPSAESAALEQWIRGPRTVGFLPIDQLDEQIEHARRRW